MKKPYIFHSLLLFLMAATLTGCDLIAGIFEAGVWVGVFLVVIVIVVIIWILKKVFD